MPPIVAFIVNSIQNYTSFSRYFIGYYIIYYYLCVQYLTILVEKSQFILYGITTNDQGV